MTERERICKSIEKVENRFGTRTPEWEKPCQNKHNLALAQVTLDALAKERARVRRIVLSLPIAFPPYSDGKFIDRTKLLAALSGRNEKR